MAREGVLFSSVICQAVKAERAPRADHRMHMRALKLTFGTSDQRYGCVGNVLPEERADSSSSGVIIVIASGLLG